jgi:cobalt-zinc-cadmium efflux system outer membrane protein
MLMAAVRDRSAVLQVDHLEVDVKVAEARQSRLLDNPVLDGAVGTIPLGTPNPPELPDPLSNIPNYSVGLSLHPDLARRGARITRAERQSDAAEASREFAVRREALRLLRILGDLALATLRLTTDQHLAAQSRSALALARDRVRTGYGPPLDSDRAEIEVLRLEQQVAADQGDVLTAQATCAEILGMRCARFGGEDEARRFLASWTDRADPSGTARPELRVGERPDLRALAALEAGAQAEARLASAQWVPDPTLRVGYMYDRFIASGNQQHSLSVSLSLPLPLLDHGQAAAEAAGARVRRYATQRQLTTQAATARSEALRLAMATQRQRLLSLQQQVVPRGQAILNAVRRAFEARAVPLTDLNQAHRALDELLLQEATALGDVFRLGVDLIELGGGNV